MNNVERNEGVNRKTRDSKRVMLQYWQPSFGGALSDCVRLRQSRRAHVPLNFHAQQNSSVDTTKILSKSSQSSSITESQIDSINYTSHPRYLS